MMTPEQEKIIEDLKRAQSRLFDSQSVKSKVFAPQGSKIEQKSNLDATKVVIEDDTIGDVIEMSRNSVQQVKNSVFEKEDEMKIIRHASSPDIHKENEKLAATDKGKVVETNSQVIQKPIMQDVDIKNTE